MIVGVLSGPSLREYRDLAGGASAPLILPPVVWLSSPTETISQASVEHLTLNTDVEVHMEPVLFRDLYNHATGISGLYAACLPEDGSSLELRRRIGVLEPYPDFVPSFLVVHDAMRSFNTRKFFRAFNSALARRRLTFTLFIAEESNPEHQVLFENYNPEVNHEMSSYVMMRKPGTSSVFNG